jgi:hypothetical protein
MVSVFVDDGKGGKTGKLTRGEFVHDAGNRLFVGNGRMTMVLTSRARTFHITLFLLLEIILNIPPTTNTTAIREGARCSRAALAWRSRWYHRWPRASSLRIADIPGPNSSSLQVEQIYETPSLNGVMDDLLFLQNIPSIVVGHLLDPQPGMHIPHQALRYVCWNVVECCELIGILHAVGHCRPGDLILDMCAAPGGKTTHIAALANDRARIFALDKNVGKGALHSHLELERKRE